MAISKDLQTTQAIIGLFEKSKERCEESLENLPGVYCVVSRDGTVLKGNIFLASLLDVDVEDLLGINLVSRFAEKDQAIFADALAELKVGHNAEFQLTLPLKGGERIYLWSLSFYAQSTSQFAIQSDNQSDNQSDGQLPDQRSNRSTELIAILGRDLTDITRAIAKNERMQVELDTARLVQETLFPNEFNLINDSILTGISRSATECGGDWWHFAHTENRLLLWVGDVTGHGVPAALVMSAVNAATYIIAQSSFTPKESLRVLDRAVRCTARGKKFMTCFVASIDLLTGQCVYASAAHEAPIVVRAELKSYTFRDLDFLPVKPTFPLGTHNLEVDYEEFTTTLKPGDRLCLYTDGVYDLNVRASSSAFFRSFASLVSNEKSAVGVIDEMKSQITRFQRQQELPDDVTMIVFQYLPRES